MDYNFTSEEYNIVTNKTFHLMENISLDEHSMNVNSPAPSAVMMMFSFFLFLIVEILGNFLLISMITYEKYGMDSQKRTVTNQLLSSICVSFILHNVIAMPIFMLHRIYHMFLITQCKKIFSFCGLVKEFNYLGSR
jgi:hypothetical protein